MSGQLKKASRGSVLGRAFFNFGRNINSRLIFLQRASIEIKRGMTYN